MVALTNNSLHLQHLHRLQPATHPRRVAVVLNVNARKVDAETLGWVRGVVAERDLFVSRTLEDVPRLAEQIVAEQFDAVLFGGGDGTFASGVAALARAAERQFRLMPTVGALRFGTGNAMAETIGASEATPEGLARDLHRARARAASQHHVSLLEVEGQPSMFCGFGLDALILDDFIKTVGWLKRAGLATTVQSGGLRYFLSVTSRSIPRFAFAPRTEIVAVNRGAPAIRVDVNGNQVGAPIPAGRVLWRGKASLAAAASIPFYGFGLKMFPHAQREPGRFQLRLATVGIAESITHLKTIWEGRYQGDRIHDFLVDKVELVLSRPAPFQAGGEPIGERGGAIVSMWQRQVAVV